MLNALDPNLMTAAEWLTKIGEILASGDWSLMQWVSLHGMLLKKQM